MKDKKPSKPTKSINLKRASNVLLPVVDKLAQLAGVVYIIATSYAFTHDWLKTHQFNHDYSVAGGIMVVSIALYLVVRKR